MDEALPRFSDEDWSVASTDETGRLNISRDRAFPEGSNGGAVLARITVSSPRDQVVRLGFGLSDRGSVWLNGRPLFEVDNTYLSRSGRYLGVMTVEHDALLLPLEEGDNELVFAVSEAFGGWGLIGRLPEDAGLLVHAGQGAGSP